MWKKAVPAVAMCSLLLVGCNTNKTVPTKNETPMQDVREGVDRVNPNLTTPEVYTPTPGTNNMAPDGYKGVNGNNRIDNVGPTGNEVVPDGNVIKGTTGTPGTTGTTTPSGVKGQMK